jgi:hypothetical protein
MARRRRRASGELAGKVGEVVGGDAGNIELDDLGDLVRVSSLDGVEEGAHPLRDGLVDDRALLSSLYAAPPPVPRPNRQKVCAGGQPRPDDPLDLLLGDFGVGVRREDEAHRPSGFDRVGGKRAHATPP